MSLSPSPFLMAALTLSLACSATAQESLTLDAALKLAKERNGTIKAATYDLGSARSRLRQSQGTFLPTVSPSYSYSDRHFITSGTGPNSTSRGSNSSIELAWKLLDSGQRSFALRSTSSGLQAQEQATLQVLRTTLFAVTQQYYEALRAQELRKVAEAQVERARVNLDQTKAQVEQKIAPKKDVLQAEADFLNAKVQLLQAQNRVNTAEATLSASVGWAPEDPFPQLAAQAGPTEFAAMAPMTEVIKDGLKARPDLKSQRFRLASQTYSASASERNAGIQWSVDSNYSKAFQPTQSANRLLSFNLTYPLFDGNRSREEARQSHLSVDSAKESLVQSERSARSEIEAEYRNHAQNARRYEAAKLALDAARLNYEAAVESQRLGAEGTTIVVVLTARVSLVTAESNYIEATYDYFISDARLKLVTGVPVLGEQN